MKRKTRIIIRVSLVIAALLVFFRLIGDRALAVEAVYPVSRSAGFFTRHVLRRVNAIWSRQKLFAENETLRCEVAALGMVRTDNEELLAENARLRKALDFRTANVEHWQAAEVLSRSGTGAEAFLRVSRGKADGIREGAAVAVPDGLVGRAAEVTEHTCVILPLAAPSVKVACDVESSGVGRIRGILSGVGDAAAGAGAIGSRALALRHLRRDCTPSPRARVVTSGEGGLFPRGLLVGFLIGNMEEDGNRLERTVAVEPAVDFDNLEIVFIRCER